MMIMAWHCIRIPLVRLLARTNPQLKYPRPPLGNTTRNNAPIAMHSLLDRERLCGRKAFWSTKKPPAVGFDVTGAGIRLTETDARPLSLRSAPINLRCSLGGAGGAATVDC